MLRSSMEWQEVRFRSEFCSTAHIQVQRCVESTQTIFATQILLHKGLLYDHRIEQTANIRSEIICTPHCVRLESKAWNEV